MKSLQSLLEHISLSAIMSVSVTVIVVLSEITALSIFVRFFSSSMENNAMTASEQAVAQVANMVQNYTLDMEEMMDLVIAYADKEQAVRSDFYVGLLKIRPDLVTILSFDSLHNLREIYAGDNDIKERFLTNLSYQTIPKDSDSIYISKPHVESLLTDYYPFVVTMSKMTQDANGKSLQVAIDLRFQKITNYVDEVGIGTHGYCYILDDEGEVIYHPQQLLIDSNLKEENTGELSHREDGSFLNENVIYTIHSLDNCNWRIVGVSYVDEMITQKVSHPQVR